MNRGNDMFKNIAYIVIAVLVGVILFNWYSISSSTKELNKNVVSDKGVNTGVFRFFSTDLSKRSIELEDVLSGGPGKDGIPALNKPKFVFVSNSKILPETEGLFVENKNERRFYPFSILVWHEIVLDKVGGVPLAITFCPLCGSAIVFERMVDNVVLDFGVSGFLFESNLLMYDKETESLWSQAKGEAVVGDKTGTKLTIFPAQILSFAEVKKRYADTRVLSTDTGFIRDYTRNPYSGYEEDEKLFFPVSVNDKRFPAKTPMYVIPFKSKSITLSYRDIPETFKKEFVVEGEKIVIEKANEEIIARLGEKVLPGYFEMWFSWAIHHQKDGVVLDTK